MSATITTVDDVVFGHVKPKTDSAPSPTTIVPPVPGTIRELRCVLKCGQSAVANVASAVATAWGGKLVPGPGKSGRFWYVVLPNDSEFTAVWPGLRVSAGEFDGVAMLVAMSACKNRADIEAVHLEYGGIIKLNASGIRLIGGSSKWPAWGKQSSGLRTKLSAQASELGGIILLPLRQAVFSALKSGDAATAADGIDPSVVETADDYLKSLLES